MKLSIRIKRLAIGVVIGASLLVGAAAPAFAQHHDRHNRNNGNNRRGGIFGSIFGGNNHRHRNSDRYRRRGDRRDRWDDYYGRDARHNRNRGRGHNNRW